MIIDIGLHVDAINHVRQNNLSAEDVEIRRRVFWGAYSEWFFIDCTINLFQYSIKYTLCTKVDPYLFKRPICVYQQILWTHMKN